MTKPEKGDNVAAVQEIPFGHIWNGRQGGIHCSFTLEHVEPQSDQLSCDVIVSQTLLLGNQQIIPLVVDVSAPAPSLQVSLAPS